ncbi:hypothetical protein Tco_0602242 [Tanacetum coccineum]
MKSYYECTHQMSYGKRLKLGHSLTSNTLDTIGVYVPTKTRSLTIAEEIVVDMYNEWGQKFKGLVVEDPVVQSSLDLRKGSKASRLESLRQKKQPVAGEGSSAAHNKLYDSLDSDATFYSSSLNKPEESANETNDADESNMDFSDDNPDEDDDVARYGVFMHNKSTTTPNSTYLSPMVTSSLLDFIQTLLDETLANKLTDFMSHPVYTDAQTTLVVHNPEGNPGANSNIRPRLNTSVLEVMKTNQINIFTQSSTSTDDLSNMDLKNKAAEQNSLEQVR